MDGLAVERSRLAEVTTGYAMTATGTDQATTSQSHLGALRRWVRCGFYGWLVTVFVAVIGTVVFLALEVRDNPFFRGGSDFEIVELRGHEAKGSMRSWPATVDVAEVASCSFKSSGSIDSHSQWICLRITPAAATAWIEDAHQRQAETAKQPLERGYRSVEMAERTVAEPRPLHHQTGTTPSWWQPPKMPFRATEVMLWYDGNDSGIGRATYSAFNEQSGQLWIYEYSAQHDLLWQRGRAPVSE